MRDDYSRPALKVANAPVYNAEHRKFSLRFDLFAFVELVSNLTFNDLA